MSTTQLPVRLSEHWADGKFYGYRKYICGHHFTLSKDRATAERQVAALLRFRETGVIKLRGVLPACEGPLATRVQNLTADEVADLKRLIAAVEAEAVNNVPAPLAYGCTSSSDSTAASRRWNWPP